MSKSKRAKSGSAHDVTRWENGLVQAILNEDAWKTCIFFVVANNLEDNALIDISCEVAATGLRKLFSIITKEGLFKEVKEFVKASGGGGGKGKPSGKLPDFVEVCEQVKPFIDQDEDIPAPLLAKLLKFKLLHLKTKDHDRREEEKKERSKETGSKKSDKRSGSVSPGKGSKSPRRKGKKGEPEPTPSLKKDTKLKKRGEVEDTFKPIDDEPDNNGSPQHYILIHGFIVASTLQHLANIGIHVNAIIKIKQNEYITNAPISIKEKSPEAEDFEVEEGESEHGVSQMDETDEINDRHKEETKLATFWKESDDLVVNAPTGHKLKDIAKYEVVVTSTLAGESVSNVDVDKKTELGTEIFEKIANVCYDMLDHQKSYQRYLDSMKLLHIPLHTPSTGHSELSSYQPAAPSLPSDGLKEPISVEIDMRYYTHLVSSIPDESISVPLILHCVLEQVVASVDETNPMDKQLSTSEDGLDHQLAAHINSRTASLALSIEEKQVLLQPDNEKKRRENIKVPQILDHNDKISQRLHYLEDLTIMDALQTELSMLDVTAPRLLYKFPHRTIPEIMETGARFHQFTQHCSFANPDDVSRLLKKYTFEGMPLKSVDVCGNILEPFELDQTFSSYTIPWDDPYSDLSKYFSTRSRGQIRKGSDCSISAVADLVSFRNLDEWCYIEQFDKNTLTQVLDEALLVNPYVDSYYHKHDDTLLIVFHNPVGKQLYNRSTWNTQLHSNVGFRNYLEHVSNMIREWNAEQDFLEEEESRTPTPAPPTPEPPRVQIKACSRYGLKTRAEIAALKAEEEDKGKKKNKRSARSRTPKSGKKSQSSKEKSAGSQQKTVQRATSGSLSRAMKSSKAKLGHENELQPEPNSEELMDEETFDFLGFDVGDDLLHVTGVLSSMFPNDGGQIRVEKTTYVHRPSTVSTSVYKDGNILKLHFLEPLEELIEEKESDFSLEVKEESFRSLVRDESNVDLEDGVEKSEFEENEKQGDSQADESTEPPRPVFCKHSSFVALLNDGMVISSSGFGPHGNTSRKEPIPRKPDAGNMDNQPVRQSLGPSPQPKAASPKSRKKNEEEIKRLEELRQAEERKRAEEDARRLEELQKAVKKPFHEIFVSCPDGLHVSYQNDENYCSFKGAGGVVVRQRYPVKSRGLHNCEAVRGKTAMKEKSRRIRTDGTVIKIMSNNSVEVLYPDGMTSKCPVFPTKRETSTDRPLSETFNQPPTRKAPANSIPSSKPDDEPTDQSERVTILHAEWTTVTPYGEKFVQNLDGSKTSLEQVKVSVAMCPVTQQIYKTREDNVITVIRPNQTQVVEHSDGTRITTFYKEVQTEIHPADHETGEEAKYESHLSRHVKVECEGFATVITETESGSVETLFSNGSKIMTQPNGYSVIDKPDGSQLYFDIKGTVTFVPREVTCNDRPTVSFTNLTDCWKERHGVYFLRTTSQNCCEMTDQGGNAFSVFANGEIKITKGIDMSVDNTAAVKEETHCSLHEENDEHSKDVKAVSSLPFSPHVPRFFVMRRGGSGYEMLRHQDVCDYLEAAEKDASIAVLRTPVEGYPGVTGITVLKPFNGGIGKTWLKDKVEKMLIPEGLRERDFKVFPAAELKKIGPKFGSTAGSGLNVGNMKKYVEIQPQLTCPKVLILRHLIQHEPSNITHRQNISAAFQAYGDFVLKQQLQADDLLPHEPRDDTEIKKAKELARKYEPTNPTKYSVIANNDAYVHTALAQDYLKSVTPAEPAPAPPPVWKRPPEEWERDRIELAKLDYGKHALRHQEVPPYFETSQGQAFLAGLRNVPDMEKLTASLDKRACPDRPSTDLSGSLSSVENVDGGSGIQGNRDQNGSQSPDRHSSTVLENLDNEGRNSLSDQRLEGGTPFATRPVNPTPAQAAGGPTPISVRPTNPTPKQASNVIGYENSSDSPRINNIQSMSDYIPLEALLETRNEVAYEEEECCRDNDTALDLNSSATSQYNEDSRPRSLFVDVTGSPRKEHVKLPNSILGGKPGALPNTQFSTIEEPVRRKVHTVSVTGSNVSVMRGFELLPPEVDFGVLKEGCTYVHSVIMKNVGIDSCRFKIRQPPPSTGMKVLFTPGPVAAGMSTKLDIEIFAIAVGVSGESGVGSIGHHVEIVGETDIIYLPITATILTAYEYDNRSPAAPQGGPSQGTQMVSNRPPSREAIRPRRDHLYSNVSKQF